MPSSAPDRKFSVFILGAGFSKLAGLPLGQELWREVLERARDLDGRAAKLFEDLEYFFEYQKICYGRELNFDTVDLEEFLGFLDIEHFLWLRGGDTWSQDGNESQIVIKTILSEIICKKTPEPNNIPNIYRDFVNKLLPGDVILSFNYDCLLENALDLEGIPYRLVPSRYKEAGPVYNVCDDDRDEVVVLKLHGSINWFDKTSFINRKIYGERVTGKNYMPQDPVFDGSRGCDLEPISDGVWGEGHPLENVFVLKNPEIIYHNPPLFLFCPLIMAPSTNKLVYFSKITEFWSGMSGFGCLNFRMALIGYSLPEHDEYARQIIYSIIRNYQMFPDDSVAEEYGGREELVMVDFITDETQETAYKKTSLLSIGIIQF
ncbi:MAG: SIR2 family protein [Alphaproteobacteria bacterium]|nr:SIR2 family protein [Alphaproteobacteria bacterium]